MKSVRSKDTALENKLYQALLRQGIHTFSRNEKSVIGKPDFVFFARKLAVFCDGDFWHGYNWEIAKHEIKTNRAGSKTNFLHWNHVFMAYEFL